METRMNNLRTTNHAGRPALTRAFTLVEVLVAVAIIGVLMAVLVPALSKARECTYLTGELVSARELGTAHRMYATDHSGNVPPGFASQTMVTRGEVVAIDQNGKRLTGLTAQRYPWRLISYFEYDLGSWYRDRASIESTLKTNGDQNSELFRYAVSVGPRLGLNQVFVGGSADTNDGGAYAFNPTYADATRRAWGNNWYVRRLSDMTRPTELLVFATSHGADPVGGVTLDGFYRVTPPNFFNRRWSTQAPNPTSTPAQTGNVSFRYSKKAVGCMGDGHAEALDWDQMQDMRRWAPKATSENYVMPPL